MPQRARPCASFNFRFSLVLAEFGIVPACRGSVFWRGAGMSDLARTGFPADGLWSARPDCELGAHFCDVVLAEHVADEFLVGNAVELPAGIGEVLCGQTWIEPGGRS